MVNKENARKILGKKYKDLTNDRLEEIIGFLIMLAKIDYAINTK